MTLLVTIEQAALNAFAAWLTAQLPTYNSAAAALTGAQGVKVSKRWPSPDKGLPERAVTILFAGEPEERWIQPVAEAFEIIHDAITAKISVATATDDATAILALNAARVSYESSHRTDTDAHATADTANAVTAPAASDQASAIALADDMLAVLAAHLVSAAHANADAVMTLAIAAATPTTSGTLNARANVIVAELNRHYVARLWWWRLAEVEQPVQLDAWATTEPLRDDLVARLVPLLFASAADSAGFSNQDPVRNGCVVPLGNGWPGHAAFEFDSPRRSEDGGSVQEDEFRQMYRGTCRVWRLVKAQSSRLAQIQLQATIGDRTKTATVALAPAGAVTETYS